MTRNTVHQPRKGKTRGRRGLTAAAALGLTALVVVTGCSTGQHSPAAASSPPVVPATTPTIPPATNPIADSRAAPKTGSATGTRIGSTDLAAGRHSAQLRRVDAAGRRITVDVVQLYFGAAAERAAREDGAREIPPPNGYWIRNVSPRLRTLPVAPGAQITVNVHGAAVSGSSTADISRTLAQLAAIEHLDNGVFWLTLTDGQVTRVAEQYLP